MATQPDPWLESYARGESEAAEYKPPPIPAREAKPKLVHDAAKKSDVVVASGRIVADKWNINEWLASGMVCHNSKPVPNISNISIALQHLYPGEIWYDKFLQKIICWDYNTKKPREWTDADDINVLIEMQQRIGILTARKGDVRDAIIRLAYSDERDELIDYLDSLEWDGIPRIKTFFTDVCGVEGSPYVHAIGQNFFVGLVARAKHPGIKLDNMVVLQGSQGIYKSTLLERLGGKWYTIMREAPESKDFAITLQGKWLIEIAEMDALSKSDVKTTKRTLSTATDRYRPLYGRNAEDHARRSILVGTTNRDDWLSDETGARRFWPMGCGGKIDLDLATTERDQYFAEACAMLAQRATYWDTPIEETRRVQRERYEDDPWSDIVMAKVSGRTRVKLSELLTDIGVELERQDKKTQGRVGAILRLNGWKSKFFWLEDRSQRLWIRDDEPRLGPAK